MATNTDYTLLAKRLNQRMVSAEIANSYSNEYAIIQRELAALGVESKTGRLRFPERIAKMSDADVQKFEKVAKAYESITSFRAKGAKAPEKRTLTRAENKYMKTAIKLNKMLDNSEAVGADKTYAYKRAMKLLEDEFGTQRFPVSGRYVDSKKISRVLNIMISLSDDVRLKLKKDTQKTGAKVNSGKKKSKNKIMKTSNLELFVKMSDNVVKWERNHGNKIFGYYRDKNGNIVYSDDAREEQIQETAMALAFWAERKNSKSVVPSSETVINSVLDAFNEDTGKEVDPSGAVMSAIEEWGDESQEMLIKYGDFSNYIYNKYLKG